MSKVVLNMIAEVTEYFDRTIHLNETFFILRTIKEVILCDEKLVFEV